MNKKTFTTNTKANKKAFSLIELSIVLIIIGLLIAGVTGGASLIKNAELRGVMNEARGYQTAVNSFYAKFNALPGDYPTEIVVGNGTGNNDGVINFYTANTVLTTAANRMEGNIAWQQLISGLFIDGNFAPAAANAATDGAWATDLIVGTNIPSSKLKNSGWVIDNNGTQNVVVITGSITTDLAASAAAQHPTLSRVLSGIDSLSIDTKIDNGVVATGTVRGYTNAANYTACTYTGTNVAADAGCALSFLIDPTA